MRSRAPVAPLPEGVAPTEEIKVIGIRRVIAQRMTEAKRNIPHFAYVEEIDITELTRLMAGGAEMEALQHELSRQR